MAADLFSLPAPTEITAPRFDLKPIALLKEGWEFIKPQYVNFMLLVIAMLVATFIVGRVPLGFVFSFFVTSVFSSGVMYYLVKFYRGEEPTLNSVLAPIQRKPGEIIIVSVLQSLLIVIGLFFLVLPGLYLALVLTFALPLVVFTSTQPTDALFLSRRIVHQQFGQWFVFFVVIIAVNMLAILPLGLGLLVSIPATAGAFTIVVARLFGITAGNIHHTQSPPTSPTQEPGNTVPRP